MQSARDILAGCDRLASISAERRGLKRIYLSPEHARANALVAQWMEAAGMTAWQDAAGNQWGRFDPAARARPALVIGSHLDTVPNAGRFDGMLGVLLAIAVVSRLQRRGVELPFALEVVGFGDEEGTRFGTTLLGSQAVAGQWKDEWWQLKDDEGVTLERAFRDFGLDPARIGDAARAPRTLVGYLEAHIEQGPVLEAQNQPLGVVTAIAGARRFAITLTGQAGHAGTTPFELRRDALCGAAEAVIAIEALARAAQIVATVGRLEVAPGAVNVIPGSATFTLDIRAAEDALRDRTFGAIEAALGRIAEARGLRVEWRETHRAPAVGCAERLQAALREAVDALAPPAPTLFSGAGHDGMAMAAVTEIGMLFLRCKGGVSHHPDESVMAGDVEVALEALERAVILLAERYGQSSDARGGGERPAS